VKSFAGKHQLLLDLTWGNKNFKALMTEKHKNSIGSSHGGVKNLPNPKKTRKETPLREGGVEPPPEHPAKLVLLSRANSREKASVRITIH
jgi:hypothetical protein